MKSIYASADRLVIARTLTVMYAGAGVDALIELLLPGAASFSLLPVLGAIVVTAALLAGGHRLPRWVLLGLGLVGVVLIGYAQATTPYTNDGAALYALPVIFLSLFWGRRGSWLALGLVAGAELVVVRALPGPVDSPKQAVLVILVQAAVAVGVVRLGERGKTLLRKVTHEAQVDPLTGVLNRRGFDERAQSLPAGLRAVVSFDVDHFKRVNDRLGHDVGDRVLQRLARILRDQAPTGALIARFGGEEFLVLIPRLDCEGAITFADAVRAALRSDRDTTPRITVSAGVSTGDPDRQISELIQAADDAMYRAKHLGRDRTCVAGNRATPSTAQFTRPPVTAAEPKGRVVAAGSWIAGGFARALELMRTQLTVRVCALAGLAGLLQLILPADRLDHVLVLALVAAVGVGVLLGRRAAPRWSALLIGPLGIGVCTFILIAQPSLNGVAMLYALPVLWQTAAYGRRGGVLICAMVAVGDAIALLFLPPGAGHAQRWVDVMVSIIPIAVVIATLESRNHELVQRVAGQARIDPLTGLLNRRGFDDRGCDELHRHGGELTCAVVAFDIDHFKSVNDRWGHDTGDRILSELAGVLRAHARREDILARFGGEEFIVLLPDTELKDAIAFAERVRRSLADNPDGRQPITVSAGVAAARTSGELGELCRQADVALYDAKRTGRNRIMQFSSSATPVDARHPETAGTVRQPARIELTLTRSRLEPSGELDRSV